MYGGAPAAIRAHFEAVNLTWSAAGKDPRLLIFASKVSEDLPACEALFTQ